MENPSAVKRILIVDNDPDLRDALEINLRLSGYQVSSAESYAQALALAEAEVFDLAIIDKRLQNHGSITDATGFQLAISMPEPIKTIIYTAYDDYENANAPWKELGMVPVIDKCRDGSGAEVVRAIEVAFLDMRLNLELEFQPAGPDLDGLATSIELAQADQPYPPTGVDLTRIFQRLFADADALSLKYLILPEPQASISSSGSVLLRATAQRGRVWCPPEVVKLCNRAEAIIEADNYQKVYKYFNGNRIAHLDSHGLALSRTVGGLLYRLIESDLSHDIISYRLFYQSAPAERIVHANRLFFKDTFGHLYRAAQQRRIDLLTLYAPALHLTPEKLAVVMARTLRPDRPDAPSLHFDAIRPSLPNPVEWAVSNGAFCRFDPLLVGCSLAHGDLHNRNILVDATSDDLPKFWLIDLARAGESHNLRDIVELETDIKFTLLQSGDAQAWFDLEAALLTPARFDQPTPDLRFTDPEVDKAYQVIAGLRATAAELTRSDGDLREYYEALFVHTLNAMRLKHIGIHKKEHALLSAAMVCQRLENWPDWEFEARPSPDFVIAAPLVTRPPSSPPAEPRWPRSLERAAILLLLLVGGTTAIGFLLYATWRYAISWSQWFAILLSVFLLLVGGLAASELLSSNQTAGLLRNFLDRLGNQQERPPDSLDDYTSTQKEFRIDQNDQIEPPP